MTNKSNRKVYQTLSRLTHLGKKLNVVNHTINFPKVSREVLPVALVKPGLIQVVAQDHQIRRREEGVGLLLGRHQEADHQKVKEDPLVGDP